jgi:hypothetical protein
MLVPMNGFYYFLNNDISFRSRAKLLYRQIAPIPSKDNSTGHFARPT